MIIGIFYLLSFWGCIAFARQRLSPAYQFLGGVIGHYLLLMGIFFLATWVGSPLAWLTLLPLFGLRYWRGLKPYLWYIVCSLLLVPLLYIVPLAENDSVGYVLPMADGARFLSTSGTWYTDAIRAIRRLWGLASNISVYLYLSGGSIHGASTAVIPGFLGFLHGAYMVGRKIRLPRKCLPWLVGLLLSSPAIFTSLFTLKDDLLFAAVGIFITLLILVKPKSQGLFPGWVALITSKLFYPLYALFLLPFYRRLNRKIIGLGLAALITVLILNANRAFYYQFALKPTQWQYWALALSGATDKELGLAVTGSQPVSTATPYRRLAQVQRTRAQAYTDFLLHNTIRPITRIWTPQWYNSFLWFPNYSSLLGLGCLLPLALFGLVSPSSRLLFWQRARWFTAALLFSLGFVYLFASPTLNNIRYLFLPSLVLACLSFVAWPKCPWLFRGTVLVQIVTCGLFLATPPVTQAAQYWLQHQRPAFATNVVSLNPSLPRARLPHPNLLYPLVSANTFQTAGIYLLTDGSQGKIYDTTLQFDILEKILVVAKPRMVVIALDFVDPPGYVQAAEKAVLVPRLQKAGYCLTGELEGRFLFFTPPSGQ